MYTAESLMTMALAASAKGLVDPSVTLTDVTCSNGRLTGSAERDLVTLTVEVPVDDFEALLSLIASELNAAKPAAAKSKPVASKPKPEPDMADDADF